MVSLPEGRFGTRSVKKQLEGARFGAQKGDDFVEYPGSQRMELLEDTDHLNHSHAILALRAGAMCLIEQTWGVDFVNLELIQYKQKCPKQEGDWSINWIGWHFQSAYPKATKKRGKNTSHPKMLNRFIFWGRQQSEIFHSYHSNAEC